MGAGLVIVLREEIAGMEGFVSGRFLAREEERLSALAEAKGVRGLMEFFSTDPGTVEGFLKDEGLDPSDFPESPEQWFEAEEGLATAEALCEALRKTPGAVNDSERVLEELEDFLRVLRAARDLGARWHLEVDY